MNKFRYYATGVLAPLLISTAQITAADEGKKIYDTMCFACHKTGVANAPKLGDEKAWKPRLEQGIEAMYSAAIKGKNAMPPKGGATQLSDEQIKQAVDYMVSSVQAE